MLIYNKSRGIRQNEFNVMLWKVVKQLTWVYSVSLTIVVIHPVGNYMFKVNNRNTRTSCEICPKLTIKTPERRFCC